MEDSTSVADIHGDNHWTQVARKHWLGYSTPPTRIQPDVVKNELWDPLEKDDFSHASLQLLESLQTVERCLWPSFKEDSSNYHVLLIALLLNVKRAENLDTWSIFDRPADFSFLFRRFLSLSLDTSLSARVRTHLLLTLIGAFQSLDSGLIRKECAPLVSISIWHNLQSAAARDRILEKHPQLKKAWRAAGKRYDVADEATKTRQRFERSWLFTLVLDFFNIIYERSPLTGDYRIYCERFMELLTDIQSQFPTRRYVNTLLKDLNILVAIKQSSLYRDEGSGLFRDFHILLRHYTYFPIDDHTGQSLSFKDLSNAHNAQLVHLQRISLKYFKTKLTLLALSNHGSLEQREELKSHFEPLSDAELKDLAVHCRLRIDYPPSCSIPQERSFLLELLYVAHEKPPSFRDSIRGMRLLPTESSLYEPSLIRNENYNGMRPLAIPKLNLQYLTTGDFLWRAFILFRCEAFYEIRKEMEDVVKRLQLKRDFSSGQIRFGGSSRMALKIPKPGIVEVIPAKIGEQTPAQVRVEIVLDLSRMNDNVRREWESLRPDEVVFLLGVNAQDKGRTLTNGNTGPSQSDTAPFECLRAAEVLHVTDDNGRPLRLQSEQPNGHYQRARQRRLLVKLDAAAYQEDVKDGKEGKDSLYENLNVIVRRRSRENNFKPILESIRSLATSEVPMPTWLQDVFLGIGDPAGATYKQLANAFQALDFRDTFLNWDHLLESFPDQTVTPEGDTLPMTPPYILATSKQQTSKSAPRSSKKRRRDEVDENSPNELVKVSTYTPTNMGPYPTDARKTNAVRFTPSQVEAIKSGTQPGLTVVVGPPGTGKTDVATQIINNIYHNFPQERTLLVAHSNQALNQLFQKIVALDIDERHLLRLGHGEGELQLETDTSYNKYGRVESFLEIGSRYLLEVTRLASSIDAPGAHGNSCETAHYFNSVYVRPLWKQYWEKVKSPEVSVTQLTEEFPFHIYFSNAPQPLFPPSATKEETLETAAGCYRHIEKIFAELEDIRPFEILRNARDRANYLLVKEARIIAMTSTHAAINRQEIANLGFQYDNVIMEEAAQITEIENFIPLALQQPREGTVPLKRVILCGDHLQNSPIVQNFAFRQYANLEQSLFLRLVRLGVPTVMLDQQGRARSSLAELYSWRYPRLGNLQAVVSSPEFLVANPGFCYDFQFINVPDYKGKGEMEPTPHFIQNLGEAEYAVALFMFMRLLGYPASKISILTMYAGQRALIKDVLSHRCAKNRLFGLPRIVTTVDKYQGEQNDYVILSLTRTSRIGYLRDIRRITVALSRARLGLYIFGRREVFEACPELKEAFDRLFQRPDKLQLVIGEIFPTSRRLTDEVESTPMEGVEHLGQYVFEMTQAKVASLRAGAETLPTVEEGVGLDDEGEDERNGPALVDGAEDDEIEEDDGGPLPEGQ